MEKLKVKDFVKKVKKETKKNTPYTLMTLVECDYKKGTNPSMFGYQDLKKKKRKFVMKLVNKLLTKGYDVNFQNNPEQPLNVSVFVVKR
jgi:hypothetical protein